MQGRAQKEHRAKVAVEPPGPGQGQKQVFVKGFGAIAKKGVKEPKGRLALHEGLGQLGKPHRHRAPQPKAPARLVPVPDQKKPLDALS